MNEHSIDTQTCERFDGVQDKRKRIGNLDFDTASHCVYHLTVHVIFRTNLEGARLTTRGEVFLTKLFGRLLSTPTARLSSLEATKTTSTFSCAIRPQSS